MNIILFENAEIGKPLPRRDERTLHLLKVLHKKAGDTFDAGILGGNLGTGKIDSVRLDGSIAYSLDLKEEPPPRYPIHIAVGFPRPIQIRRLLRDLSNLGLLAVDIIGTELGEKSYRDTKLLTDGGAKAALIEGAVQARDTCIPALSVFASLEEWLAERSWERSLSGNSTAFTERTAFTDYTAGAESTMRVENTAPAERGPAISRLQEKNKRPIWSVYASGSPSRSPLLIALDNVRPEGSLALLSALGQSMVLAVGSERGWSDKERNELEASGFLRLSMGERALRTETACTAAAVLALEKIGALG